MGGYFSIAVIFIVARMAEEAWAQMKADDSAALKNYNGQRTATVSNDKQLQALLRSKKKKKDLSKPAEEDSNKFNEEMKPTTEYSRKNNDEAKQEISMKPLLSMEALQDPNLLIRVLQRDINLVESADMKSRKAALIRLKNVLFPAGGTTIDHDAVSMVFEQLQKPLLKRLLDRAEKCRELAVTLIIEFLKVCSDLGRFMPYLFPVLNERASHSFSVDFEHNEVIRDTTAYEAKQRGRSVPLPDAGTSYSHQVTESSEEIRYMLCDMLGTLVDSLIKRGLHSMLGPYFHDVVMFFHASAVDPFPALRVLGLSWLEKLATEERFCNTMHHYCTALVRSVMPSLRHRLSKVKIAAIKSIQKLVSCPFHNKRKGGGTDAITDLVGYREDNVIPICAFYQGETRLNYFGYLLADENQNVRLYFYAMIGDWMTTLLDRWDHASRLLPFLMASLSDSSQQSQLIGLESLEELGLQYEDEHQDKILEMRQYGVDGAEGRANYEQELPSPWITRPKLSTRLFVRSHTNRFLTTVLKELNDWKATTKIHAIGLLRSILIYTEENITMELHLMIQTLVLLAFDPEIHSHVSEIAVLLGRYADPDSYLPFLLPHVTGETAFATEVQWSSRARALSVLNSMLIGSMPKRVLARLVDLVDAISAKDLVRGSLEHTLLNQQLKATTTTIVNLVGTGRTAVDAIFIASGRLNSLTRQYTSLFLLSVYLNEGNSFETMISIIGKDQFEKISGHISETDPLLGSTVICNYVNLMGERLENVSAIIEYICNSIVNREIPSIDTSLQLLKVLVSRYPELSKDLRITLVVNDIASRQEFPVKKMDPTLVLWFELFTQMTDVSETSITLANEFHAI